MRQASCSFLICRRGSGLREEAQAEEVSGTRKSPRESEATAQELDPWRMAVCVWGATGVPEYPCGNSGAGLAFGGAPGTAWFFPTSPKLFVENPSSLP